jgi:hypothetical protein
LPFIALGLAEHSLFLIVSSAVFLVLPLARSACRQHGTPAARS